jgi:hypothetical protein
VPGCAFVAVLAATVLMRSLARVLARSTAVEDLRAQAIDAHAVTFDVTDAGMYPFQVTS